VRKINESRLPPQHLIGFRQCREGVRQLDISSVQLLLNPLALDDLQLQSRVGRLRCLCQLMLPHRTNHQSLIDRRHLLVTNVASNDVSVFAVNGAMLELTKTVPVGMAPRSIAEHDGRVFVLNTGDATITGFRLVEGDLVVELKCAERLTNEHVAQCLNYLRASGLTLCLLVNFQKPQVEWRRIVLGFQMAGTPESKPVAG